MDNNEIAEVNQNQNNDSKQIESFKDSLSIEFSETKTIVTFKPKTLLRGSDKWCYPYPFYANAENITVKYLLEYFGEEFTLDIFLDGLIKLCQQKWRQASDIEDKEGKSTEDIFKEIFFLTRRDTGPTPEKLAKEITKRMKELKLLKDAKGKDDSEVKKLAIEIKNLRQEMNNLQTKEMEML